MGNLLFQYSSLYGTARRLGRKPVVPDRLRILNYFHLDTNTSVLARPGASWMQYPELRASAYDANLITHLEKTDSDAEMVGYFQSWYYFRHVTQDIRKQYTFSVELLSEVRNTINVAMTTFTANHRRPSVLIGIHVRRGDMTSDFFHWYGYTTAPPEYIETAMQSMEKQFQNIMFIVSSDDIEWSERNINAVKRNIYFSRNHSDVFDLALLTSCDHVIMTVGTFGWWAGFLAGGQVVYYSDFPAPQSSLSRAF
uniref:L-Fucosyltransferase n=1 Tax=Capitella teleta TaxID=283909 RepID=X2B3C4_CAPTE